VAENTENRGFAGIQGISNPPRYLLKRWYSLWEAGIYTGFKEITLRQAVYSGELNVGQRGDRGKWYFDVFELDSFMLANFGPYKGPVDERPRAKNGRFKKQAK
jgi:hypothetical protein